MGKKGKCAGCCDCKCKTKRDSEHVLLKNVIEDIALLIASKDLSPKNMAKTISKTAKKVKDHDKKHS
jgi:hypothetical protein